MRPEVVALVSMAYPSSGFVDLAAADPDVADRP
jgi:hypothetical protein